MSRRSPAAGLAAAGLAVFMAACDGTRPSTPSSLRLAPAPSPVTRVPTPTLTSISPNVGSTSGGAPVVITGTGLLPDATATFDDVRVPTQFDFRYMDRIYLSTPPHAAGTVAVRVSNPGGEPGRLDASYTYVPPESFDFNGTWSGYPIDGSDLAIEFTIENDKLLRVSCDTSLVEISPPLPVTAGAFTFSRDGAAMTGKIVSDSQAVGAIRLAPCDAPLWEATKRR